MSDRLDKKLVDLNLVSTRSQASQLIKEGVVFVDGKKITKASFKIDDQNIEIKKDNLFVGRGAHKIEGALKEFHVNPQGLIVADVGASTGGFTEYVLMLNASKVYAIDVGHDQLAQKLRDDERVINMEGTNIRDLDSVDEAVDLAVVDLSFISLKLVLKNIISLLKESGEAIVLVKPQFEVGKEGIGKGGIVKSPEIASDSVLSLFNWCGENSIYIDGFCQCSIKGKTGNQEYFFHIKKAATGHAISEEDIKEKL